MPGRPAELKFKPAGTGKRDFPGMHQLEKQEERGRLLHFFANHELLATELMALVLLRFPDAPAAFRRGVLQTLKDEQEHTRWYIERMKECGISFGELPVSGYFWRAVSGMETPMDYVAGLSLTFEQANLDFAKHFAGAFAKIGDAESATLLERIYRDEIGHVAYGLKWFRRWKNPNESDWEAFRRQLKFPLSPQRAKGLTVNVEGRRAAGFEKSFIEQLAIYSRSKGRTPSVFMFNPFAEGFIAQGRSFTPIKHQALLARDLENLPQFLCRQDDVVLVQQPPSVRFLGQTKQAGFPLPEFVTSVGALAERKLGQLRPWAWSPDSMELVAPLFSNLTKQTRAPEECFNERISRLYSKASSAAVLRRTLCAQKHSWLCPEEEVGIAVSSEQDALKVISDFRRAGFHKLVAKQALGLAGHNAIRLWEPELLDAQRRWLANSVREGRQVVLEPWLERETDFSIQLEMDESNLRLLGYTGLLNDRKGQFLGNWAAPNPSRRIPVDMNRFFPDATRMEARIRELYSFIIAELESELRPARFEGPVGMDAFLYRTPTGECRLKPIVEINPRYTMGRLTLELMNHTYPGSHGLFRLFTRAEVQKEGGPGFSDFARTLMQRYPLRLEGEPRARIREGVVPLNDPETAQVCLAVFHVSSSPLTCELRNKS